MIGLAFTYASHLDTNLILAILCKANEPTSACCGVDSLTALESSLVASLIESHNYAASQGSNPHMPNEAESCSQRTMWSQRFIYIGRLERDLEGGVGYTDVLYLCLNRS